MIRLVKGSPPEWLVANSSAKTHAYKVAASDKKPNPWNRPDLKMALMEEAHGKCMYCETSPADSSYLAVEHIRPKSLFPDLVLEWANLGWACTRCNTHKDNYWTDTPSLVLLNPYVDEPNDYLEHLGPLILGFRASQRAVNTVRQCQLNRNDLILSKARKIEALEKVLQLWVTEQDEEIRNLIAEDITSLLTVDQEFTASLRAFAKARGFDPFS